MSAPGDAPITAAVLGQGSIGRRHARILADLGCAVRAWDPAGVPELGVADAAATAADALDGADVAIVASPSVHHLEQLALALDHDCHVLVEKPPATSAAGIADLAARAEEAGLVVAVGFNLRFHPGPATVADVVRVGRIGKPLTAQFAFGSFLPDWRPDTDYRLSYSARADLGGGILLDAIHELDYATWILGAAAEVDARLARQSDLQLDVEDVATLSLRHADGPLSTITLDYLDRSYHRGCRIVGTDATVVWSWEDDVVRVLAADAASDHAAPASAIDDSYRLQMQAFLAAAADGSLAGPLCGIAEAAGTMRLADAARESDATGRRITLEP